MAAGRDLRPRQPGREQQAVPCCQLAAHRHARRRDRTRFAVQERRVCPRAPHDETERLLRSNRYSTRSQISPGGRAFHCGSRHRGGDARYLVARPGFSAGQRYEHRRLPASATSQISSAPAPRSAAAASGKGRRPHQRSSSSPTRAPSAPASLTTRTPPAATAAATPSLLRPFCELDARWTAGASALDDKRIDNVCNRRGGRAVPPPQRQRQLFGGLSAGPARGWVQRYSLVWSQQDDAHANDPALVASRRCWPASCARPCAS